MQTIDEREQVRRVKDLKHGNPACVALRGGALYLEPFVFDMKHHSGLLRLVEQPVERGQPLLAIEQVLNGTACGRRKGPLDLDAPLRHLLVGFPEQD